MKINVDDFTYRAWLSLVREQGFEPRKAVEWMLHNGALRVERDSNAAEDTRDTARKERETACARRNEEPKRRRGRVNIGKIPEGSLRVNLRGTKYIKFNNKDSREIMAMRLTHFSAFTGAGGMLGIKLTREENAEAGAERVYFQKNGNNLYAALPVYESCDTLKILRAMGVKDGTCANLQFAAADTGECRVVRIIGYDSKRDNERRTLIFNYLPVNK